MLYVEDTTWEAFIRKLTTESGGMLAKGDISEKVEELINFYLRAPLTVLKKK